MTLYGFLMREGNIPTDWFSQQVAQADRTDGGIDTLSNRIAHVRTWTFVANRPDWLADPEHWQGVTRAVEDKLSDALHERLAERFVDRRTSVLMRRLRENTMLETEIGKTGEVTVEGHVIGRLDGFMFAPDASAAGSEAKALNAAAQKALAGEIESARHQVVAGLERSDRAGERRRAALDRRHGRQADPGRRRAAPAPAHRRRRAIDRAGARTGADAARSLAQDAYREAAWRRCSRSPPPTTSPAWRAVSRSNWWKRSACWSARRWPRRSRASTSRRAPRCANTACASAPITSICRSLLKPAPRALATQLWALKHESPDAKGVGELLHLAASGRTSIPVDKETPKPLYRTAGYRVAGERAVRVDILERLADLIRPALSWRETSPGPKPDGVFDGRGFLVTGAMTSLTGASGEDFASILRSLGYRMDRRPKPAEPVAAPAPAEAAPVEAVPAAERRARPKRRRPKSPRGRRCGSRRRAGRAAAGRIAADRGRGKRAGRATKRRLPMFCRRRQKFRKKSMQFRPSAANSENILPANSEAAAPLAACQEPADDRGLASGRPSREAAESPAPSAAPRKSARASAAASARTAPRAADAAPAAAPRRHRREAARNAARPRAQGSPAAPGPPRAPAAHGAPGPAHRTSKRRRAAWRPRRAATKATASSAPNASSITPSL